MLSVFIANKLSTVHYPHNITIMTVTTRSKSPEKSAPKTAAARSPRETTPQPTLAPPVESLTPSPQRSSCDVDAARNNDLASTRPVRGQLKCATIAPRNGTAANAKVVTLQANVEPPEAQLRAPAAMADSKEDDDRPRPRRKRSFEEIEESSGSPVVPATTKHIKKRSREALNGVQSSGEVASESPSRECSLDKAQPIVQESHLVQVAAADDTTRSTSAHVAFKAGSCRTLRDADPMSQGPPKAVGITEKDVLNTKAINPSEPQSDSKSAAIETARELAASKAQSPSEATIPPVISKQNAQENTQAASSHQLASVDVNVSCRHSIVIYLSLIHI